MKKTLIIGALSITALVALFFAFNTYIYSEKQGEGLPVEPYRATLSGTETCLPHKGPGPNTKECALGIKTDVGEYYALNFALMSQIPPTIEGGARFTASGVITPTTPELEKYDIQGVFSVTDSVIIDEEPRTETPAPSTSCYVGGCSSQLCSDTPGMASTCEYHESYACYRTATCERQASGECGWTQTAELAACIADAN